MNFGNGGWKKHKRRLLKERVKFRDERHVDLDKHLISKI